MSGYNYIRVVRKLLLTNILYQNPPTYFILRQVERGVLYLRCRDACVGHNLVQAGLVLFRLLDEVFFDANFVVWPAEVVCLLIFQLGQ
jgi:hypothetical protein